MKRIIGIFFLLAACTTTYACDICGCGAGSYYLGILPDFGKHAAGLRYRHNQLTTHLGAGGITTYLTTKEVYQTTELWGGWNLSKRFRLMAIVPMAFNQRTNQGITQHKNGLGDVLLNGYYNLLNIKKKLGNKLLVQSLWAGVGVKLPTGKYNAADKSTSNNTNLFQLGTGSWDVLLNAMYDLRLQDAGINASVSYKMNTANRYDYNYGNRLTATTQLYHKFRLWQKLVLAPNTGITYEYGNKDMDVRYKVDMSGGRALLYTAGMEIAYKKLVMGGNWQTPLSQNMANGFVKAGNRYMLHAGISF
jgi:hypothetical protein